MKLQISRSYSEKRQKQQFEPIDSFCAVQIEQEVPDQAPFARVMEICDDLSAKLDRICRSEVKKTLDDIMPLKVQNPVPPNVMNAKSDKQAVFFAKQHGVDFDDPNYGPVAGEREIRN